MKSDEELGMCTRILLRLLSPSAGPSEWIRKTGDYHRNGKIGSLLYQNKC